MRAPHLLLSLALIVVAPLAHSQKGGAAPKSSSPALGSSAAASVPGGSYLGGTDTCTTPVPIAGQGTFNFDTSTSTTGTEGQNEANCLAFATTGIDNDVWYCWTADATGCTTLTACNLTAGLDTKIAAYPGCGCPLDGTSLACNDDLCPGSLESTLKWNTVNGATYTLQVGSYPGASGGLGVMDISTVAGACPSTPANDDCNSPQAIGGQGTFPFDLSLATTGTQGQNETLCLAFGTSGIEEDLWYCWTADCTGAAVLTVCNLSSVDTRVSVYPGCACPLDGTSIACNDDTCNFQSEVTWAALGGTTYTIQIGTFPGAAAGAGDFDITISPCTGSGTAICFGDGSGSTCGCANESNVGSGSGCLNSVSIGGVGAILSASGTPSVTGNTLSLSCSGVRTQPGLMFGAVNTIGGGTGISFGDGIRCCGGSVVRIETINPPPGPEPVTVTTTITIPPPPPSAKRCYQYWYRDPGGPCGSNFNLSNAITVTWQA